MAEAIIFEQHSEVADDGENLEVDRVDMLGARNSVQTETDGARHAKHWLPMTSSVAGFDEGTFI